MGRRLALGAEVLAGQDEAAAEELLPEPVHGDAGGEGVLVVHQPVGEAEAVGGLALRKGRQEGGGRGVDPFARGHVAAADTQRRRWTLEARAIAHDHRGGDLDLLQLAPHLGLAGARGVERGGQRPEVVGEGLRLLGGAGGARRVQDLPHVFRNLEAAPRIRVKTSRRAGNGRGCCRGSHAWCSSVKVKRGRARRRRSACSGRKTAVWATALLPVDAPARVFVFVDGLGDAPAVLGEIGRRPRERHRARPRPHAEPREDEVAGGRPAGTARRQRGIGERLEAEGRDPARGGSAR